jgi:hypothetical protein
MNREMTPSERFVHDLTQRACLRLWTYASPQGKGPGVELCDTLVACPPDVIVISVKEIALNREAEDMKVAVERWKRKAVDESVKQVHGAVRRLLSVDAVTANDGSLGVVLGAPDGRRVHRVAVAIGGEAFVPLRSRDFGQGFVHVFSADSFLVVMQEMDTITDLVQYLTDRERLLSGGLQSKVLASERDLLTLYVRNQPRSFAPLDTQSAPFMTTMTGLWEGFVASAAYAKREEANEVSYLWDRLIEQWHEDHLNDNMEFGGDLSSVDETTRVMARENRTQRRALAEAFVEFMDRMDSRSRLVFSSSATTYVFLKARHAEPREDRVQELTLRAWVARGKAHERGIDGPVLGIATEVREPGSGFSLDAILLQLPEWTKEHVEFVTEMGKDLDYFENRPFMHKRVDEFPRN